MIRFTSASGRVLAGLLLLGLGVAAQSEVAAAPRESEDPVRVAFVGGTVWPVSAPRLREGTVLVEDGKILAVGRRVEIPAGTRVIDCRGRHLSPGFVAVASRGALGARGMNSKERASDRFDPFSDTMLFALAAGITTAHEHGGSRGGFGGFGRGDPTAFSGTPTGQYGGVVGKLCRGSIEGFGLREPSGVFFSISFDSPARRRQSFEAVEKAVAWRAAHREYVEKKLSGEDVKPPRGDDVTKALARALDHELPVFVHAEERSEIEVVFELVDAFDLPVVLTGAREAWTVASEIGRRPIAVLLSPRGTGGIMSPTRPYTDRFKDAPHGWRVDNAARLAEAGVPFGILPLGQSISTGGLAGRDLAALPLDAAFTVRGGLSEEAALRALTLDAARILMVDDSVGSLEEGKDADLLVLDRPPLDYRMLVEQSWVNGRLVYDRAAAGLYAHIPGDRSAPPGAWRPYGIWSGPDGAGTLPDPAVTLPPPAEPSRASEAEEASGEGR